MPVNIRSFKLESLQRVRLRLRQYQNHPRKRRRNAKRLSLEQMLPVVEMQMTMMKKGMRTRHLLLMGVTATTLLTTVAVQI
jgi:hypothetical protein